MNRLYLELYEAFSLFNREFFDGSLPEVMITLERNYRIKGYFSPERFIEREEKNGKQLHEIALNPEYFGLLTVPEILSTLFHEMVHLEFYGNDRSHLCWQSNVSLLLNMLSRLDITFLPRSKRHLISWLQSPS